MKKHFLIFMIFIFLIVTLPLKTLDTWMLTDIRLDIGDIAGVNNSYGSQFTSVGNNIYVVWEDYRNGNSDIYYNYSTDNGVNWQTSDIRLDIGDTAGANNSWRSQITSSGSNVYVVWEERRNGYADIYFNYSTDNGVNWQSSDIRLDTGDTAGAYGSYYPQITCSESHVYVVWFDERNGSEDIYFNYSTDGGVTWQTSDIRLDTGDAAGTNKSSSPQIVGIGNNVYVVWKDYRNGNSDIYYNYSADNGVNWQSSDIRLDTGDTAGANGSYYPQITCSESHVYVVWCDERNGLNDIYLNYSTDNGVNWQSPDIRLDTGDIAGANHSFSPQVDCTENNVYVVWNDYRNDLHSDIYYNYSADNGVNWQSSDIRLDTGEPAGANDSYVPQITCFGNNVYVVWSDYRNGSTDIYFNYSTDIGANWLSSDIRLDTGDTAGANGSYYPQVTCYGNHIYVIWQDERNGCSDIYFNKAIPWIDIKANGSDGPVNITQSDTLQIKVSLNRFGLIADVDYWLAYKGPFGWIHYNNATKEWEPGLGVSHQGPLIDLNNKKVFQKSGLAPGNYLFYFGVDMVMDGNLTKSVLYYDQVMVTITQ